jgi:hypothetical protein
MAETLRPMNLGGILDRAVQIYRTKPLLFIGLGAIPGIAELGQALAKASNGSFFAFVFWLAQIVLFAITTAATCLAASRVNLGEATTLRESFGAFRPKALRLIGLSFLQGLYAGWPIIIATIIGLTISSFGGSVYPTVAIIALGAIPCIALYTRYALAFPATAIENLSAPYAIERSKNLSQGGRWRICWGVLVPAVPSLAISFGASALIDQFKTHSPLLAGSPLAVAGINGIVDLIAALIFTPYAAIVLTLLYYDQRMRNEAFDVEHMMAAAGLNASPASPAASPWTQINASSDGDA